MQGRGGLDEELGWWAGPRTLGYYQDFVLNAMENYVRALGWRKTWVGLPFFFFFLTLFFYFYFF